MIRTIALTLTLTLLVPASSLYAADEKKDEHPADGAPRIVITIPDQTPATVRPASLLPMYVALTGLQAYDGYSTLRGVGRGGSEQNPLVGGLAKQPAAFLTLTAVSAGRLRHAFLLGLLTGGIYFTGTLYWITRVMVVYGGLQGWIAVPLNAALIAYLALFPGLFALVVRRLTMAHGPAALMAAPLVWVATELGRTHLLTGFPWVLLGYSQATVLPIAQLASVFGVYGVSMRIVVVSAALALFAFRPSVRSAEASRSTYVFASVTIAIVVVVALWGSRR